MIIERKHDGGGEISAKTHMGHVYRKKEPKMLECPISRVEVRVKKLKKGHVLYEV